MPEWKRNQFIVTSEKVEEFAEQYLQHPDIERVMWDVFKIKDLVERREAGALLLNRADVLKALELKEAERAELLQARAAARAAVRSRVLGLIEAGKLDAGAMEDPGAAWAAWVAEHGEESPETGVNGAPSAAELADIDLEQGYEVAAKTALHIMQHSTSDGARVSAAKSFESIMAQIRSAEQDVDFPAEFRAFLDDAIAAKA